MLCPSCSKRLPYSVRFCAYCGAAIQRRPWRAWLEALSIPSVSRPQALVGVLGAALGALLGGACGVVLGDPARPDALLGGFIGALGVGVAAAWGHTLAAPNLDRDSARRFGQMYGGVGGALAVLGGLLAAMVIMVRATQPVGWRASLDLLVNSAADGFPFAVTAGFLGAAFGILAGRFAGRIGYSLLQRRGAILGAAMAWTVGGVIGGLYAGQQAAVHASADPVAGALLGMVLQVALGAIVLTQVQRLISAWRAWWRGQRRGP